MDFTIETLIEDKSKISISMDFEQLIIFYSFLNNYSVKENDFLIKAIKARLHDLVIKMIDRKSEAFSEKWFNNQTVGGAKFTDDFKIIFKRGVYEYLLLINSISI